MDNQNSYSTIIGILFKKWEEHGVDYCHWKSIDHLEATFQAKTDIDVLVGKTSIKQAIKAALDAGFIAVQTVYLRGYPSVHDYVAYDAALNRWIHLHFHTQIICGDRWVKAYHIPCEDMLLRNRIWHEHYHTWIIAPEHELLLLILRMNAKFRKNWLKDSKICREIDFLLESRRKYKTAQYSITDFFGEPTANLFLDLLKDLENRKPISIKDVRKQFDMKKYRRLPLFHFILWAQFRHVYRICIEVRRRWFKTYDKGRRKLPYGGMVVAFVGIDGSGKSTGIERTTRFFAQQMNTQRNFLGSGKSGASWIRKLIMSLFGFKATFKSHQEIRQIDKTEDSGVNEKRKVKSPPLYYLIWIYLCLRDRERHLRSIRRGLANGKLILVDRWLQDSVSGGVDSPRLARFRTNKGVAGWLARREQVLYGDIKRVPLRLALVLSIDPETSLLRKPGELDYEGATQAIEKLETIQWPKETVISKVDATASVDEVTQHIYNTIWLELQKNG